MAAQYVCKEGTEISNELQLNDTTIHRLFLTATVMALKFNEDYGCSNKHYAEVGGISLAELNKHELDFFTHKKERVFISPDDYLRFQEQITDPLSHEECYCEKLQFSQDI